MSHIFTVIYSITSILVIEGMDSLLAAIVLPFIFGKEEYTKFEAYVKFEARRRVLGIFMFSVCFIGCVWILMFDTTSHQDLIAGWSEPTRLIWAWGFWVYVKDTILLFQHPRKKAWHVWAYALHHFIANALYTISFFFEKGSFVGAVFMIASSTNVIFNFRWCVRRICPNSISGLYEILLTFCVTVTFGATAVAPLVIYFILLADQKQVALVDLLLGAYWSEKLAPGAFYLPKKCFWGSMIVFIPHVGFLLSFINIFVHTLRTKGKVKYAKED